MLISRHDEHCCQLSRQKPMMMRHGVETWRERSLPRRHNAVVRVAVIANGPAEHSGNYKRSGQQPAVNSGWSTYVLLGEHARNAGGQGQRDTAFFALPFLTYVAHEAGYQFFLRAQDNGRRRSCSDTRFQA